MRALILAFLCFTLLFATTGEKKSYVLKENELLLLKSLQEVKSDKTDQNYTSYKSNSALVLQSLPYPSEVYTGEVFAIKLSAKTDEKTKFELECVLLKTPDLLWLNEGAKWLLKDGEYTNTLYFEASSPNAKLSKITVNLTKNKEIFQSQDLLIKPINIKSFNPPTNYSNLVASTLNLGKVKTTRYDDTHIITIIPLNATNSNLKDFHLKDIASQGVEDLEGDIASSRAFYFAITPQETKDLNFSYFSLETQSFKDFSIQIKIEDDVISTQSDLNPKTSKYAFYKLIIFCSLIVLFALLFLFFRSFISLLVASVLLAFVLFITKDNAEATLLAGARAQILPTKNSTFFFTNKTESKVEILGLRKAYVKVLLPNQKIGWVLKSALRYD